MPIVTLSDVKPHLHIDPSDVAEDAELEGFIDAISAVVENVVGVITPQSFTQTFKGGSATLVPAHQPIVSVQSVTEYAGTRATVLTAAATPDVASWSTYTLDENGIITRGGGGIFGTLPWLGASSVIVVYTAGWSAVPPNVRLGALELVRLHWDSDRGGRTVSLGGQFDDEAGGQMILGFFVPGKILELLGASERTPMIH